MKRRTEVITEEELREAVESIAEIIHMELPLRYQDSWLEGIMDRGIWRPDPEIVEGSKTCCRNGCEKCEQ